MNPSSHKSLLVCSWIVYCLSLINDAALLHAVCQSESPNDRDRLASRLALLDINNQEQFHSEADSLRLLVQTDQDAILRTAVDFYISLVEQDRPALSEAIGQMTSRWKQVPDELKPTILRLGLTRAFEVGANDRAEAIYKELTRYALRDDEAIASRRESVELIGFINGLLEDTEGTIPAEVRSKADIALSKPGRLAPTYTVSKEKGKQARTRIDEQRIAWEQLQPDEKTEQLEQLQEKIDDLEAQSNAQLQETRTGNADQRVTWQATFQTRKRLVWQLAAVEQDMALPTDGHPGIPPTPPVAPSRSAIHVNEYETKRERRGNEWVMVRERRDDDDIERERDTRYREWQNRYVQEKTVYDQHAKVYRAALEAWTTRDLTRRKELRESHDDLVNRISQIDQEKKANDQAKKESMKEIEQLEDSLEQLQEKLGIWKQLAQGDQLSDQNYAVRANGWKGIDLQLELQQILKWLRKDPLPPTDDRP